MGFASNLANLIGADPAMPVQANSREHESVRARRPARILVVDDEAPVRSMIGATLQRQGYEVQLAISGAQATDLLEKGPFDLVLTDIVMQDGNGIALLERLHVDQPHLPVVMVSAIHDISVAIDSMRRGAYDYLLKPFEREHLVATVQRALDHRQALQESHNYQQNLEQVVRARTEMLRQAMEDLEHSYDVTLEALGDALDLKDSETEGHSKRVTAYTIALARAMGISPVDIKIIARGAFLHDIGKMAIPDEILRKPGKLTPEEEQIMRDHCTRGYHILRKIPFLSEAAAIVYTHQEHFDGNGYPSRLRGNEIPIGARIFAVADAMDAITSDRPYRKARSFDEARQEVLRCSGTQFDPNVVEVFLKIPNELWHELRAEINGENRHFSTFDFSGASATPAE
ncbi:MAG TPA: HD domain-containing phosphohydrolase [Terracidiphilus sp.]|jgi:putative nucleotidyltransferase with HDIG domain|nr:HD domain-containing phosphohydrolase [Terracidiphilus sp.]